jgi:hypothetical protein
MTLTGHSTRARAQQCKTPKTSGFSRAKWLNAIRADRSLSRSALHVAAALADHFDRAGSAFPSVDRLARLCAISARWARRLIAQLVAAGHLAITPQSGRVNIYRANSTVEPSAAPDPQTSAPSPDNKPVYVREGDPIWSALAKRYERLTGRRPKPDAGGGNNFPRKWQSEALGLSHFAI